MGSTTTTATGVSAFGRESIGSGTNSKVWPDGSELVTATGQHSASVSRNCWSADSPHAARKSDSSDKAGDGSYQHTLRSGEGPHRSNTDFLAGFAASAYMLEASINPFVAGSSAASRRCVDGPLGGGIRRRPSEKGEERNRLQAYNPTQTCGQAKPLKTAKDRHSSDASYVTMQILLTVYLETRDVRQRE